jgi:uncharacterized protein YlxW (UPF0749 family)
MSLLVDLSTDALDPGYAAAATRKRSAPTPDRPRWPLTGVTVLAATLVVVVAAVQTRVSAPAAAKSRSVLLAEVNRQSAAVARLERSLAALRAEQAALRDATLASSTAGARLSRQVAAAELALGTVAVVGPGLRITLADASSSTGGRSRVLDRDLQDVVNALWAAGAEAVAVNGERLTAQSAIRTAGDAILVDFRPQASPYVVLAVGSSVDLETRFGGSRTAARMRDYAQLYGLGFHYDRSSRLTLPAAADTTLRYARPVPPVPTRKGPS